MTHILILMDMIILLLGCILVVLSIHVRHHWNDKP